MISSFLFHFALNGKKKVPHNHKIPLWFHPGYIHTNWIYRLNLRFSGQLYSHIRRRRSTAQKCIGLISKEYLSSCGIYKMIKVFLLHHPQHCLHSRLLRRSFFSKTCLEERKEIFFVSFVFQIEFFQGARNTNMGTYNS